MIKDLTIYTLPDGYEITAAALEEALQAHEVKVPTGIAIESCGFAPVAASGAFVLSVEKRLLFEFAMERKIIPPSVVERTLDDKVEAKEQACGFRIGRRAKSEIKEQVVQELAAKAFSARSSVRCWFDLEGGWLVVGSATASRADQITSTLRNALGELPVTPAQSVMPMGVTLTQWISSGEPPGQFDLDDEVELVGQDATKSTIRCVRQELTRASIKEALAEGKTVTKLGLTWADKLGVVMTDTLQLRRVSLLDMPPPPTDEQAAEEAARDPDAELTTSFTIFSGTVAQMLVEIKERLMTESAT